MNVTDLKDFSMSKVGDRLICKFSGRLCMCAPCEHICDTETHAFLCKIPELE